MSNSHFAHDETPAQHLPTEILIAIVDLVNTDEDLLALATTSRRFHDLSLRALFLRHDINPLANELRLVSCDDTLRVIKGLAIALDVVGASLDYLSYDCGQMYSECVIKEVQLLTRYTAKLTSINRVSLRLAAGFRVNNKQFRDASITLLNTVLCKSCKDIHVTTSQISSFYDGARDKMPSDKPANWLKNYWPAYGPPTNTAHLKTYFIQTFPAFLRPFYYHTLYVNSAVLTELSFKNIFGSGTDWATMILHLSFPNLQRLTVIYGVIPRDPFVKFLAKHPVTLTFFEYHHIRYEPRPKYPQRSDALKPVFQAQLQSLVASPEHIINFLPPFSCLSKLSAMTIKIDEPVRPNFAALEAALMAITKCTNKLTLTLEISLTGLGFGRWFDDVFSGLLVPNVARRPEPLMRCVQALVMDNGDQGFADAQLVARLPVWLRLFPELRMLTLIGGAPAYKKLSSFDAHNISTDGVISTLREACPDLYIEYCGTGTEAGIYS